MQFQIAIATEYRFDVNDPEHYALKANPFLYAVPCTVSHGKNGPHGFLDLTPATPLATAGQFVLCWFVSQTL